MQWVVRPTASTVPDFRGYAGRVAGGVFRPGDEVMVLPSGLTTTIAAIDTFDGPVDEAFAPMSVMVRLAEDLDVSRGDLICRPHNQPTVGQDIDAMMCWMAERPLAEGDVVALKHTTRWVRAQVRHVHYSLDVNTLHRDDAAERAAPQRRRPGEPAGHPAPLLRQLPAQPLHGVVHRGRPRTPTSPSVPGMILGAD